MAAIKIIFMKKYKILGIVKILMQKNIKKSHRYFVKPYKKLRVEF
jgi:hypothetical protein